MTMDRRVAGVLRAADEGNRCTEGWRAGKEGGVSESGTAQDPRQLVPDEDPDSICECPACQRMRREMTDEIIETGEQKRSILWQQQQDR